MKKINKCWVDENNNRWSIFLFTEEEAEWFSKSLVYCNDCYNCSACRNCNNCNNCNECNWLDNKSNYKSNQAILKKELE